jgi:hypothetical protein
MFVSQGELAMEIQQAIKKGWEFEFNEGERKFNNASISARKGEIIRTAYCGVGELLALISQYEYEHAEKMK